MMTVEQYPEPPDIDVTKPNDARMYDYVLGGKDNVAADREAVDSLNAEIPGSKMLAIDNRAFLRRGVRFLVGEAGIRQIIDFGSGPPTQRNVHEIAHDLDPDTRVLYVDNDPTVLAHARVLLACTDKPAVIAADAADPKSIFESPITRALIDLDQPYAVLMVGLLHWLSDEQDPVGVTAYIRDRMPSGSYLLVSGLLDDDSLARDLEHGLMKRVGRGYFRPWSVHRQYFEGLEMIHPGLVYANLWRPDLGPDLRGTPVLNHPTKKDYSAYLIGACGMKR